MLGAVGLVHLTARLEQQLRRGRIDQAVAELPAIRIEAAEVIRALSQVTWPGDNHSPSR
jgi:hypothetical protein